MPQPSSAGPEAGQETSITVTGKVFLQRHGDKEWVVIHSVDAVAYVAKGVLLEKLREASGSEPLLVTIKGTLDGSSNTSCQQMQTPEDTPDRGKQLTIEARCVRYLTINVAQIIRVFESDTPIPEPKRDPGEEQKVLSRNNQRVAQQAIMGEIYGKIKACDLRSVVKTIEVQNLEKNNPIKSLTLLITGDTRIAKKIGKADPVFMLPENLKVGQRVTVVYSQRETGKDALFITITKE